MRARNYFFALIAVAALAFAFYGIVSFSGQLWNIAGNYALSFQEKTHYLAGSGKPVFGVLHSIHTTFGGAAMTQAQRVAALKSTYDWAATVDHDYSLSQSEWDSTRNEANTNNSDNSFTYFPGYEWKGEKGAEVLVFFKDNGPSSFAAGSSSSYNSISELSSWLAANNGMGQANHPARTGSYNFNDTAYVNETQIPLISMINKGYWHWNYSWDCAAGSGCTTYTNPKMSGMQGASGTGWVKFALDKGYHYGFTGETDEHEYPLTADAFIGLVDPPSWTREGVFETLRKRHTWAAEDKIMMSVTANNGTADYVMGDIFGYRSSNPNITINYDITAVSGKTITDVSLFYKGIIVKVEKFSGRQNVSGTFSQSLTNGKEDYLFIEAIQSNGKRAWSSPMWITFTSTGGCTTDPDCSDGNICCDSVCRPPICTPLGGCGLGQQCVSPSTCTAVCQNVDCVQGAITSACYCQGAARENGYCCNSIYQTTPCAALCGGTTCTAVQLCCNNSCTTPACTADANCQAGQLCVNPGACAAACQDVNCVQGIISSACYCSGQVRGSGYCCGGVYQATACPCVFDSDCNSGKICCNGSCSLPVCTSASGCNTGQLCVNPSTCSAVCQNAQYIDTPILMSHIAEWKRGELSMLVLMQKMKQWKAGKAA